MYPPNRLDCYERHEHRHALSSAHASSALYLLGVRLTWPYLITTSPPPALPKCPPCTTDGPVLASSPPASKIAWGCASFGSSLPNVSPPTSTRFSWGRAAPARARPSNACSATW